MKMRIEERGNGFANAGRYVTYDGTPYRIVSYIGIIQTGGAGAGNWCLAEVEEIDWDDADEDEAADCACRPEPDSEESEDEI